jgi:hypothetical protein
MRDYRCYAQKVLDQMYEEQEYYFMKHCKVIALHNQNLSIDTIAEEMNYAESTVKNYINMYLDILLPYALGLEIKPSKVSDIYYDYEIRTVEEIKKGYCAYLVYLNTGAKNLYSKVGYSGNPNQRFCALERNYEEYCYVVPKAMYYFENKGAAESMENYMREYYKNKYYSSFIEKDRFVGVHFLQEDIELFDKIAEAFAKMFVF